MKPEKRRDGLVVTELLDEVLVYDLDRHRAHCLNRTAALVFRHAESVTTEFATGPLAQPRHNESAVSVVLAIRKEMQQGRSVCNEVIRTRLRVSWGPP